MDQSNNNAQKQKFKLKDSRHEGFMLVPSVNEFGQRDPNIAKMRNQPNDYRSNPEQSREIYDRQIPTLGSNVQAINTQGQNSQKKPNWMPDYNVENCMSCLKKFTVFKRRHHCRMCEKIFCSQCSIMKMMSHEKVIQKIRICRECDRLHVDFAKDLKDKKMILKADEDYLLTDKSKMYSEVNTTKLVEETKQIMDKSNKKLQKGVTFKDRDSDGSNEEDEDDEDENGFIIEGNLNMDLALKKKRKKEGLKAAQDLLTQQSRMMSKIYKDAEQEQEQEDITARSRSILSKSKSKVGGALSIYRSSGKSGDASGQEEKLNTSGKFPETEQVDEIEMSDEPDLDDMLYENLQDIRNRVIKEFDLDHGKWSNLLAQYVNQAIQTVRPSSYQFSDSIDITKYVKIQLVQFKDTSKSKYVNGVVIKKSIAHKRMNWEIYDPKILLLSNSLGYIKDEQEFLDLETEIKQEDSFIHIVMKKIELVNPNLIFVQNDASMKAIEALLEKKITVVTNVKQSVMKRLGRLTQTINCPSTNLLNVAFNTGKCERFFMEQLTMRSLNRTIESNTNLIHLEGCLPFLGCTILLSGPDMNELKIVKHALKKMLRLSRQITLEYEYLVFLNLTLKPLKQREEDDENAKEEQPFLHKKHMQRDFLIFKECSFSKRGINQNKFEDDDDEIDNIQNKVENQAVKQSEKEVQARIQLICQNPQMKRVHFYNEDHEDLSLVSKLRELCTKSVQKCKKCEQYQLYHVKHFYHKSGYVEMKMRFSKEANQNPEVQQIRMKTSHDKQIFIQCQCESCKVNIFPKKIITKQLQELSFYNFLEQFFYNNKSLFMTQELGMKHTCNHSFHESCKIIFLIDILRIEFQYHPVDIYSLDLICFKDMPGSLSHEEMINKFMIAKKSLIKNMSDTFEFIITSINDLNQWLMFIRSVDLIKQQENQFYSEKIIDASRSFLDRLQLSLLEYQDLAHDSLSSFEANNEFKLNKVHKMISSRVCDYIFLLKTIYSQIFDEFIPNLQKENKKMNKKDHALLLNQMGLQQNTNPMRNMSQYEIGFRTQSTTVQHSVTNQKQKDHFTSIEINDASKTDKDQFEFDQDNGLRATGQTTESLPQILSTQQTYDGARARSGSHLPQIDESLSGKFNVNQLIEFEERLKQNQAVKELMKMSPSIPNGFDMNCTMVNVQDFSTIICQALLSNDHIMGLKEQGYMNLEQRLDKYTHINRPYGKRVSSKQNERNEADQYDLQDQIATADAAKPSLHQYQEEYLVFKENQDILNKQISQKEIETELLRLENYNFHINFNTYKGPKSNELVMMKDRNTKNVSSEKVILSKSSNLDELNSLTPVDLSQRFYQDFNVIVQQIHQFKVSKETNQKAQNENPAREISQEEKYLVHALFYPKTDLNVKIYYPSHFQALRKLYCGSFDSLNEQMFKSSFWLDNTGGKSKSEFYKSYNEKYVMKVINGNEMRMFCEFALPYFEYMCRSFNQKCPTALGKILGAFKIRIRSQNKTTPYHVILMENLTIGIDPYSTQLSKYDLKGSMANRYVDIKGKVGQTRLDTNFLEDHNSRPICMNYTMQRLLEIAIHNDTSFLSRHEKIDYSLLAWIDHEQKLIRVGIIDYIQYYSFEKLLESKIKKALLNQGKAPTILNPTPYKQRFQEAMKNYFMSILEDKPIESFDELIRKQSEAKRIHMLLNKDQDHMFQISGERQSATFSDSRLRNTYQMKNSKTMEFEDKED